MSKERADDPGSAVAVGIADTPVAGANGDREGIYLTADPRNTARIWLRKSVSGAVVGQGIPLAPGDSYVDDRERPYWGPYCAIAEAAGQVLCKMED